MKLLNEFKKKLFGNLALGFVTLFIPISPIGLTGTYYTLEELSFQNSSKKAETGKGHWHFKWVHPKGFVLQRSDNSEKRGHIPLQHAVYRTVVDTN